MSVLGNSKCWNCGSLKYYNTISIEECPSCGIKFEYHGSGANEVYQEALDRAYWEEHHLKEEEFEEYYRENYE